MLLGSGEEVLGKKKLDECIYKHATSEVHHYHSDNGIFTEDTFLKIVTRRVSIRFFGVLELNIRNSRAERAIQTMMYTEITFMMHTLVHYTDYG